MLLIKNGHIKTMAGPDLENGCVLIDDNGKMLRWMCRLMLPKLR